MNETQQENIRISQQGHLLIISKTVHVPTIFKQSPARRKISGFSKSAACRMGRYLRCSRALYRNMVTLTYPQGYPKDGRVFKDHLRRFLQELQRYSRINSDGTRGTQQRYSAFWFLEFQKRGAAHFHIFTTDDYPKEWIARTWYRIVGSDDDRHLRAGTRIERMRSGRRGVCSYALKYAAKADQKAPPEWTKNVGRFWGVSGDRFAVSADTLIKPQSRRNRAVRTALENMQTWLKHRVELGLIVRRVKGTTTLYAVKSDSLLLDWSSLQMRLQIAVIQEENSFAIWDYVGEGVDCCRLDAT